MKKAIVAGFLLVGILISLGLRPQPALCDDSTDKLSPPAKVKTVKKAKKKHKKSKSAKLKVAKSSAGAQDEVSDQSDVSQQADNSGNQKKK